MRILQLTSYPTVVPAHGGQIRAAHIASELRNAGHEVKSAAVYVKQDHTEKSVDDIGFSTDSKFWEPAFPWLSDYFSGLYGADDPAAKKRLRVMAEVFKPEVIIVEQPWLFKAAQNMADGRAKLVHSSQNIEWRLKEKLFANFNAPRREAMVEDIRNAEIAAVRNSDLTVACTEDDATYYESLGSEHGNVNVTVAGNGVEPFSCSSRRVNEWIAVMRKPTACFVSSAHLPNAKGFWDMMAPGLTFLRPDEQIMVVGGVCSILLQECGFHQFSAVNLSRVNLAGYQEKQELQAMVQACHVVLLPITDGEGSNLKTAEALESGCSIVGTTKAFRGFEQALSLPHVHIADDPKSFRMTLREVLDQPRYTGGTPAGIRSLFYWRRQLKPLVAAIEALG